MTRGDNSGKPEICVGYFSMRNPYMKFQDDISNMNTHIHTYIHTYIQTSRNQYVPHFFNVGGIIMYKWVFSSLENVLILTHIKWPSTCQLKGINRFSLRQNLRLLLTLFESKPHHIIIFHLKINRQKLEKHHINGSQTRIHISKGELYLKKIRKVYIYPKESLISNR